jgi:hypothetical protein
MPNRPAEIEGPSASVEDRIERGYSYGAGAAFFVSKIDGESVENILAASRRASYGRGSQFIVFDVARRLPARPTKVELVATHFTSRPIDDIGPRIRGEQLEVRREFVFTPKEGTTYVVNGHLSKDGCGVWLEDFVSRDVVSDKALLPCKKIGLLN